jgi:hypothetical protein
MPKPVKKKRIPPRDVNQWARHLVDQSTAEPKTEAPPAIAPAGLSAYMAALGRKGGKESGRLRKQNLSVAERRRIASQAARKRWDDVAKQKAAKKR